MCSTWRFAVHYVTLCHKVEQPGGMIRRVRFIVRKKLHNMAKAGIIVLHVLDKDCSLGGLCTASNGIDQFYALI